MADIDRFQQIILSVSDTYIGLVCLMLIPRVSQLAEATASSCTALAAPPFQCNGVWFLVDLVLNKAHLEQI